MHYINPAQTSVLTKHTLYLISHLFVVMLLFSQVEKKDPSMGRTENQLFFKKFELKWFMGVFKDSDTNYQRALDISGIVSL